MNRKLRAWLLAAGVAGVCALLILGLQWQRSRGLATLEAQLQRLPTSDALVLYIDFGALRRTGLLEMAAGSKIAAEPEYRAFVERTKFDYATDLDAALVSFAPSGRYFLLRGRFDWPALRAYAASSNGSCRDNLCRMPGSTPERNISFLPLRRDLMALAVSRDDLAVDVMTRPGAAGRPMEIPREPVWLSVPGALLKSGAELPAGTRMFARSVANAESLTLALGAEQERFAIRMDVRCRNEQEAAALADSLERLTGTVRQMIERERQKPNPRDLSGVLTAGSFRREGTRVYGHWPVERGFFEEAFRGGPS